MFMNVFQLNGTGNGSFSLDECICFCRVPVFSVCDLFIREAYCYAVVEDTVTSAVQP
jgi:hypothetical protein